MTAYSTFTTQKAARYMGTLCNQFGHKVPTGINASTGWIELPFARCDLTATDSRLTMTLTAPTQANLAKAAHVIGSHLERFAFREAPDLIWHQVASNQA